MGTKLAVICSTGGAGKTQLSVGLACHWSEAGRKVVLVDVDSQDTTSAKAWLDKIPDDDEATANLAFTPSTMAELATSLADITTDQIVIIDTPPKLDDAAMTAIADQVDLVLVPGNIGGDLEAVSQTAATLLARTSTPVLIVLCKLESGQMAKAQDAATGLLTSTGAAVAATKIRRYSVADEARLYGDVPTRLPGSRGQNHRNDLAGVAVEVEQRLGGL